MLLKFLFMIWLRNLVMKMNKTLDSKITKILNDYSKSFKEKTYSDENDKCDVLMDIFGITPNMKRENRQYWGRELGMCWQKIIVELCKTKCEGYGDALKFGRDEPCDLIVGKYAIDTKYRIGSGDSGTLRKFRENAALLRSKNYTPVLLILRNDNLPAAITACSKKWVVKTGKDSFDFIKEITKVDFCQYLQSKRGNFNINP